MNFESSESTQNTEGKYVPAIPEPFWSWWFFGLYERAHCECERKFDNLEEYQGHYALIHILKYKV